MLIAIENREPPICETVSWDRPDFGVAFLPAVSVRFLLDPKELRLQYEAGRLRRDLKRDGSAFRPGPGDAVLLYRKTAGLFAAEPEQQTGIPFNEIA